MVSAITNKIDMAKIKGDEYEPPGKRRRTNKQMREAILGYVAFHC
jgi:hypothetical protein